MPRIMTDKFRDATFLIPYKVDKSEGVFVTPMTETRKNEIRRMVLQESGHDESIGNKMVMRGVLRASISGWKGFFDAGGDEIPFSAEAVNELCECDPEFMSELFLRILSVARYGELEETKN